MRNKFYLQFALILLLFMTSSLAFLANASNEREYLACNSCSIGETRSVAMAAGEATGGFHISNKVFVVSDQVN